MARLSKFAVVGSKLPHRGSKPTGTSARQKLPKKWAGLYLLRKIRGTEPHRAPPHQHYKFSSTKMERAFTLNPRPPRVPQVDLRVEMLLPSGYGR